MREAWMLFGLFIAQFVLGGVLPEDLRELERIGVGIVYLVLAAGILFQQRAYAEAAGARRPRGARRRAVPRRDARRGKIVSVDVPPGHRSTTRRLVDWNAVCRGALHRAVRAGAGVSVVEAILDRNLDSFDDSGWIYPLFVVILVGYALGGLAPGASCPRRPSPTAPSPASARSCSGSRSAS